MLSRKLLVAGSTGLATAAFAAPAAVAEERTCRGTIGAATVDNLRVPQGATCVLNRTKVKGTITIERDATLRAARIRVVGNVQAENHRRVRIHRSSRIGGSIQIKQGGGATVAGTRVTGDVQYDSNGGQLAVRRSRVNGSIQVVGNAGGVVISSNRVGGNLQCKENRPAPTGGGNVVQGNKEDQCAGL